GDGLQDLSLVKIVGIFLEEVGSHQIHGIRNHPLALLAEIDTEIPTCCANFEPHAFACVSYFVKPQKAFKNGVYTSSYENFILLCITWNNILTSEYLSYLIVVVVVDCLQNFHHLNIVLQCSRICFPLSRCCLCVSDELIPELEDSQSESEDELPLPEIDTLIPCDVNHPRLIINNSWIMSLYITKECNI
ncbi:hypothetical protein L9F63_006205, partial [Diploptera punctata]